MIVRHALSAVVAVGVLLVATPFIPSSVLIDLQEISVQDNQMTLTRKVRIPLDGSMTYEIGNGRALPECNRAAPHLHFERRTEPLTFDLICEVPEGHWTIRYCVSVNTGWAGMTMAPTCIEREFQVGPTREERLEMQQMILEDKIIELEEKVNAED